MIAKLIDWCIHNRFMVLLLTLLVIAGGVWAMYSVKIDAIPDLSDVQVIVYANYTGNSPELVEKQVTYPLVKALQGVPGARAIRGTSMFGSSFVYIIFEDGTDIYWARSRVLERLDYAKSSLPASVSPQLGPDATSVGWIYQYVLVTGKYCPDHPNGAYQDPQSGKWYADASDAPAELREGLVHHRIFEDSRVVWFDPQSKQTYTLVQDAPAESRERLQKITLSQGRDTCPLDGKPLIPSGQTLADLRSLQDWYLRYELQSVEGVSEIAAIGGFEKQYQVTVDPVKLLAFNVRLGDVRMAIERSNANVGGRVVELSEREYAVQGLGYLGTLGRGEVEQARADGKDIQQLQTQRVVHDLQIISIGVSKDGSPIHLRDVAQVQVGPEMRRGIMDWSGQGDAAGGIVVMRFGQNARTTIAAVKARLAELQKNLPPGVAIQTGYDRSDLIDRAVHTLSGTLLEEITVVALVCIFFLLHARSELVAVFVVPTGVLISLIAMHLLGINANLMSLGGIAIAIGVMVDSSIVMVENAHKHLDREEERLHAEAAAGLPALPRPRQLIIAEAAREVGPSLFFALLILTVSFLPVFVLGEQSGRMFKPLAYTKTFAMAAAALLSVTIIPVLMSLLITAHVLPKRWGWLANVGIILGVALVPAAAILWLLPLGELDKYRHWIALGWVIFAGMLLVPQKIIHEKASPISWLLQKIYHPFFVLALRLRWLVLAAGITAVTWVMLTIATILSPTFFETRAAWVYNFVPQFGSEFMPPLEEGDLLYMPQSDPGIGATKARELLQQTDRLISQFPEVASVMGKAGRAETATDPAPMNMFETTITLHRDKSKWRRIPLRRFYDTWPDWAQHLPSKIWKSSRTITLEELKYGYDLPGGIRVPGLDDVVRVPGLANAWTMPIKTRIDMLSTGIKTPVGVKVMGPDLATLSDISQQIVQALQGDPSVSQYTTMATYDKTTGGTYLDIVPRRDQIDRYKLGMSDVQDVIDSAMGGAMVTTTVEGVQRYGVNLRYPQELRESIDSIRGAMVPTPTGTQVPLAQLADIDIHRGPDMIRSENARPTSWVYVNIADIDLGTYVSRAQEAVARNVKLPAGYSIVWSGDYEYIQAASRRLSIAVPLVLAVIIMLLYLWSKSWLRVLLVLLAVPFSLLGAFGLLYLMGYHLSLAVWIGMIALAGLDAETGMVMLLYLDNSFNRFKDAGRMRDRNDLWHAVHDGAVKRIRPKTMTVATAFIGLVPLLWATGAGADTMRRLAVPMIGGLTTSFIMELLIYPVVFYMGKSLVMRQPH